MRMRPCPCLLLLLFGVSLITSAEARKDDSEGRVSSAARAAATAVKSAAAKVSGASRGVAAKVSDQARSAVARVTNRNSSSTTASAGGSKPSTLDKIKSKAKDAIKEIDKEKAGKVAKKGAKFAKKVPWWGWLLIVVVVIALAFAGWYIYSR